MPSRGSAKMVGVVASRTGTDSRLRQLRGQTLHANLLPRSNGLLALSRPAGAKDAHSSGGVSAGGFSGQLLTRNAGFSPLPPEETHSCHCDSHIPVFRCAERRPDR